ncbi:MAG: hypothetical protein M3Z25_11080 [Actinomycetota bacterium]|nr:hypothetical protein [Actinomycetota bacterium]
MAVTRGGRRWVVTLTLVLVVALSLVLVVGVLRLAQLRSVPLGAPRALPAQGAGASTVELSADAATHPSASAVRDLLNRYFDAINAKSYLAWATTVVPARVTDQPEPEWRQAYASTTDGAIRISRIDEQSPGRLVALVFFISTQSPESAPDGLKEPRICWRTAFSLVGDPMLIDSGRTASLLRGRC